MIWFSLNMLSRLRSVRPYSGGLGLTVLTTLAAWATLAGAASDTGGTAGLPELELGRTAQYDYDPPVPGTYRLPVIKPAGDGNVLTPDGKRRRLQDLLDGRITIMSFIYTRCADPKACPAATGALYQIHGISEKDSSIAKNLQLVTFSFDPAHDTPRVMAEYGRLAASDSKGSEWLFLTTPNTQELAPILTEYGQRVDRKKDPADPFGPFYHLVRVYLIDRDAKIRNIYSFGLLDPRMVLADVRTLMLEDGRHEARDGTEKGGKKHARAPFSD